MAPRRLISDRRRAELRKRLSPKAKAYIKRAQILAAKAEADAEGDAAVSEELQRAANRLTGSAEKKKEAR
jgi:hypothetical protein